MFIAMNRFKVKKGSEHDFEQVWLTRETHLSEVPGFVVFHLLKGPERDDHVLYASHTIWRSEAQFEAWTRSEAFRKAHGGTGAKKPLYLGHPEFEGFTVLQEVKAESASSVAAEEPRAPAMRQFTRVTSTRLSENVGARPNPECASDEIELTDPSERLSERQ